ncbi:hypothetical protein Taro_006817 [Colocasia esculenta]|uniref:Aminotransferase-like plant mobile domain-containing protein n=1 Tax=Colocasia esculenta TaxID=4460 RepID=A0A843TPR5_COLES|nr:hypothetical protein [Colocasia esculenta]
MYLSLLGDLDQASRYSWGGATLAYLYHQLSIACKLDAEAICGSLTLLQLWSWERVHVGRPDIAMHPLAQDMPLGHRWNVPRVEINNPRHVLRLYRSELDHQEDYQIVSPERDVGILIELDILHILYRYGIVGQITLYHRMRRLLVLVEGSIWLGIGLSLGGTLLGQRTDSSTSHAGPSEPCAGTPQQPDDAGPSHFSPDVVTVSQYGLYDVGASQILTDEGMTDTQPPQSTVGFRVGIGNAGSRLLWETQTERSVCVFTESRAL